MKTRQIPADAPTCGNLLPCDCRDRRSDSAQIQWRLCASSPCEWAVERQCQQWRHDDQGRKCRKAETTEHHDTKAAIKFRPCSWEDHKRHETEQRCQRRHEDRPDTVPGRFDHGIRNILCSPRDTVKMCFPSSPVILESLEIRFQYRSVILEIFGIGL